MKEKYMYLALLKSKPATLHFLTCMNRSMKINSTELSHAKWLLNWEHTKNSLYSAQHEGLHSTPLWSWSRVLPLAFQELSLTTTRVNIYSWILTLSSFVNPNVKNHTKNEKWIVQILYIKHMKSEMSVIIRFLPYIFSIIRPTGSSSSFLRKRKNKAEKIIALLSSYYWLPEKTKES